MRIFRNNANRLGLSLLKLARHKMIAAMHLLQSGVPPAAAGIVCGRYLLFAAPRAAMLKLALALAPRAFTTAEAAIRVAHHWPKNTPAFL